MGILIPVLAGLGLLALAIAALVFLATLSAGFNR